LHDVLDLVRQCPNTRFVLDHCGKPAIRDALLEPWKTDIALLAECANVWCKLSGLVTEATHMGGASWISHQTPRMSSSDSALSA